MVIVFSVIKRCQNPQFTQFFQKAKKGPPEVSDFIEDLLVKKPGVLDELVEVAGSAAVGFKAVTRSCVR